MGGGRRQVDVLNPDVKWDHTAATATTPTNLETTNYQPLVNQLTIILPLPTFTGLPVEQLLSVQITIRNYPAAWLIGNLTTHLSISSYPHTLIST